MSYSVLLIDDNTVALEALQKTIPWESLDLKPVGVALNGSQGCEMIRNLRPDIILTDIQMPELDGLQMIEMLQNELYSSRVIFITAYEKIEYASKAIKLSAFDFLLKPVDNDELVSTLTRATASLDSDRDAEANAEKLRRAVKRTRFLTALSQGSIDDEKEFFLSFLDRVPDSFFMIVAETPGGISSPSLQRLDMVEFPEDVETVSTIADSEIVLLCTLPESRKDDWQALARRIAGSLVRNLMDVTVAVSDPHSDAYGFRTAYEEALRTLLQHNIYGRHSEIEFFNTPMLNETKRLRVMDLEQTCIELARNAGTLTESEIWDEISRKSEGRLRFIKTMLMFFCTKVMQARSASAGFRESIDDMAVYGLTKLNSEEDAKEWLSRFMSSFRRLDASAGTGVVGQVLDYLRANVTDGLVLEDVAAKFYVSPNYLSTLIRKETGITYRQHVINAKIDVAKKMLDDTRMRVEDIAYAVGYENYISFYNTFKKMENMSPTEYRFSKDEKP